MKKNIFSKVFGKCLLATALFGAMFFQQGCLEEYAPGQYYTFSGNTVASFLENGGKNGDMNFSIFIHALKTAGIWGEMRTYGEYTCFAPTDEGFVKYFADRGITSIDSLTKEQCDTIAFTHILTHQFYCKDLSDGALPYSNMMDRYLVYVTDSARTDDGKYKVVYRINQSYIEEMDDSVQNGVVHVIAQALNPSNKFLPDVMEENENISIFVEAMNLTKMSDSLAVYKDPNYSISVDSVVYSAQHYYGTSSETDYWIFPEFRYFKFTAFVEPNSVMAANGINSLPDLIAYAERIYGYEDGCAKDDYTNRNHPLNKFVSYHLLPEQLHYNQFNIVEFAERPDYKNSFVQWPAIDVEDFFETMMPHSVMRLSSPQTGGKFINRKGAPGDQFEGAGMIEGVEIQKTVEDGSIDNTAINGVYHYIDKMLVYDDQTRQNALNCRMRVMCSTLSPDFINDGGLGRYYNSSSGGITYGHKTDFCKNVRRSEQTQAWVRYTNPDFTIFRSNEVTIRGSYDISFKIPPVPEDGIYELRMTYCTLTDNVGMTISKSDRGVVQIYLGVQEDGSDSITYTACGIPVDLSTKPTEDPKIGYITDDDLREQGMTDEEWEAAIAANDKDMHNRGYMKGMDSYNAQCGNGSNMRTGRTDFLRKILTTDYFSAKKNYWFRIRLVTNDDPSGSVCAFNCIEVVPKSVYANDLFPEDRH